MIPGSDISHWNGTIDWPAVYAGGEKFVFIKATDGIAYTKTDYFLQNAPKARAAGLYVGAYHFAQPRKGRDPKQEAQFFVSTIEKVNYRRNAGWLPGVFDIETNQDSMSWAALSDYTNGFAAEYKRLTGDTCIAYMSKSWADNIAYRPLWVAWWRDTVPTFQSGTIFWQYTKTGRVSGMIGDVDRDYYLGTLTELDQLAGGRGLDMFIKRGDSGPACVYWQRVLNALGFFTGSYAEAYGPLTDTAVNAFRKSIGLPQLTTTEIDAEIAFKLHEALAKKFAGQPTTAQIQAAVNTWMVANKASLKGDPGDPGRPPTVAEIAVAVSSWMQANRESLKGEAGSPPSVEQISAAVSAWLEINRDSLKGDPGEPGKTPTKISMTFDVVETE